jgi:hypothetical protein
MTAYLVSVEHRGDRANAVTLPVEADAPMAAAEAAERLAAAEFGGALEEWFAAKVEPDDGRPRFEGGG